MKVSLQWLREWVDTGDDVPALSHALTMAGLEIEAVERVGVDTVLEINLTPNRGDCMSIAGVAREIAAVRNTACNAPAMDPVKAASEALFPVRLQAGGACPTFAGRVIRGVRAGASSPGWLQERLRRTGVRPISAVVDVTNYVMLELGQPLHAYDLEKLRDAIIVRFANPGEQLRLLDGRTIELTSDVLVIADPHKALGLAGVMGGAASAISDATRDVLLEGAYFSPAAIAGRGRRYGLVTDAAQRFERGVDPHLAERAIERATQLLLECAGGTAGPTRVTRIDRSDPSPMPIRLRHDRIGRVLGVTLDPVLVEALLRRLGMHVSSDNESTDGRAAAGQAVEWLVIPPSWRFDLLIEEDLIEEVARLYGFDNIPEQQASTPAQIAPWTERRMRNERAADLLVDRGYHEAITYSFTDAVAQSILFSDTALALKNPISAELGVMRLSLWPGLLQALRENQRRQQARVRLFEIGRRFSGATGAEDEVIAVVASGSVVAEQWGEHARDVDFFDVKADVEALLRLTSDPQQIRFAAQRHPALHPGQTARIYRGDRPIGWIGSLHPERQRALDLTYPVVAVEIETDVGFEALIPQYAEISRFPAIRRDLALIVAEEVAVESLLNGVRSSAGKLLNDVGVLSVYRGKQFDKGKKSIALGLQLQDTSRTLTDPEADALVAQVVDHLVRQFNATIRDK